MGGDAEAVEGLGCTAVCQCFRCPVPLLVSCRTARLLEAALCWCRVVGWAGRG